MELENRWPNREPYIREEVPSRFASFCHLRKRLPELFTRKGSMNGWVFAWGVLMNWKHIEIFGCWRHSYKTRLLKLPWFARLALLGARCLDLKQPLHQSSKISLISVASSRGARDAHVSIYDILERFDIDVCKCGFTWNACGKTFVLSEKTQRSITARRARIVWPTKLASREGLRQAKYVARGFEFAPRHADEDRVALIEVQEPAEYIIKECNYGSL